MKTLLLLLCLSPVVSAAQASWSWCEQGAQVVYVGAQFSYTQVQQSYPQCTVSVYLHGTTTLAPIFSDNAGTPLANSFLASNNGFFLFYAANGRYDVTLSSAGLDSPITITDVLLYDPGSPNGVSAICTSTSNDTAGFAALVGTSTQTHVQIPQGSTCTVNQSMTLPATVNIDVAQGGRFQVGSGSTVTVLGQISAPATQIFSGGGKVSFAGSAAQPFVYPQWWGALANGTHDDNAAIQAAMLAASPIAVTFPAGTYATSTQITVTNQTKLSCAPGANLLALSSVPNGYAVVGVIGGPFSIDGCLVNANNLANVYGLNIQTGNTSVTNNQIINWGGQGVSYGAGNNHLIQNNIITGSSSASTVNNAIGIGGYCYSNLRVLGNTITVPANGSNNNANGVAFKNGSGSCNPYQGDVEIAGNHFYQYDNKFAIEGGWFGGGPHFGGSQAQSVNIHDNFFYLNNSGSEGLISLDNVVNFIIHHNIFNLEGNGCGISCIEMPNHAAYGLIDDNQMLNPYIGTSGMTVNGCGEHNHILNNLFNGSTFYFGCTYNLQSGPDVLPTAVDTVIQGNSFSSVGPSGAIQIQFNYVNGTDILMITDMQIKDNYISGSSASTSVGVYINSNGHAEAFNNLDVSGNHFSNLIYGYYGQQGYGVWFGTTARIVGNFYTNVTNISNGFPPYGLSSGGANIDFGDYNGQVNVTGAGGVNSAQLNCPSFAPAPTLVVGAAAGSGATASITSGCNLRGTIQINAGTSLPTTPGRLVTMTFNPVEPARQCQLTPNQDGTASIVSQLQGGNNTANALTVNGVLPTASTSYWIYYFCP